MAPFYPLIVTRSDGKLEFKLSSKSHKEKNEPSSDQLNSKPNAQGIADFYRECIPGDVKEVDWRRKLAGMLIKECGGPETQDKNYILAALPENYRLFEHVKCKVSDDGQPAHTKNHAAGGNERQDAYLYGHPDGRRKRYRSPAEFFPHLLWLATDEAGDNDNCGCKFCSPEELQDDKTKAKEAKEAAKKSSATPVPVPQPAVPRPAAKPVPLSAAPANILTPLPRPRSHEQLLDAQYNKLFFRNGEIVWFDRGTAWGLGVIFQRQWDDASKSAQYCVQPFSHPHEHPEPKWSKHQELRPWLAWSPPPCTTALLNPRQENGFRRYTYESVDWQAVKSGRFGEGDAEVDGSILAVKAAECTYTPFYQLPNTTQPNFKHYLGIYIGAEKMWIGDALRLRNSQAPTDIMVLLDIVEQDNAQDPNKPTLTLIGDIYSWKVVQLEETPPPADTSHLPLRVREDLAFRNKITQRSKDRRDSFWKLIHKNAHRGIPDIKGRWYETLILAPLLDSQTFQANLRAGEVPDIGLHMNAQGDCNKPSSTSGACPAELRRDRREDAFGRAVPANFRISRGADEPKRESVDASKAPNDGGARPLAPGLQQRPTTASAANTAAAPTTVGAPPSPFSDFVAPEEN